MTFLEEVAVELRKQRAEMIERLADVPEGHVREIAQAQLRGIENGLRAIETALGEVSL